MAGVEERPLEPLEPARIAGAVQVRPWGVADARDVFVLAGLDAYAAVIAISRRARQMQTSRTGRDAERIPDLLSHHTGTPSPMPVTPGTKSATRDKSALCADAHRKYAGPSQYA